MFRSNKEIPLFYWSEIKFISKKRENYGDLLSKYLVEKISGKKVQWVHPKKQPWYKWHKTNYVTIGSVIHHASRNSIVWGSGIIDKQQPIEKADFRAVRGPQTRKFLMGLGYECPEVYGDPAILLPKYYNPLVEKQYKLGVIPHYQDFDRAKEIFKQNPNILVVDLMTLDVKAVTRQILSCKKCISSSLHGVIVAQAYNIPTVWVKFSDKIFGDDIKYIDYLESVRLECYQAPFIGKRIDLNEIENFFKIFPVLPEIKIIDDLRRGLMKTCPFSSLKAEREIL